MRIDWFTVIAQVVNFLVLVWLLRRFLYKPVLDAIDQREVRIGQQLADARTKQEAASKLLTVYEQKNAEIDTERDQRMGQIQATVDAERTRLFEKVKKDSDLLRSKLATDLKEEEDQINAEIRHRVQASVMDIAGKALSDLGSARLDEQIIHVFVQRLGALEDRQRQSFRDAFAGGHELLSVKSVFEIDAGLRSELEQAVMAASGEQFRFEYSVDPALLGGIELSVNDFKLGWNMQDYLNSLENHLAGFFDSPSKSVQHVTA